jgi:hypothetical protein
MQLHFGHAIEKYVELQADQLRKLNPNSIFSDMKWTGRNGSPQDFLTPDGFGIDITGSSKKSVMDHFAREQVNAVVSYESIPRDMGYRFVQWLNANGL